MVQQDNLLKVGKLVLIGCRDSDDFSSRWKILGNTPRITTVLVKSNKLRNFVVLIDQVDCQSCIIVKRVCCAVLSTKAFMPSLHQRRCYNVIPTLWQLALPQLLKRVPCRNFGWIKAQSYCPDQIINFTLLLQTTSKTVNITKTTLSGLLDRSGSTLV